MKKLTGLLLCLLLALGMSFSAQASGLTVTDSADLLEEEAQFPFLAETDELAVNVRKDTSTKSAKVGRLERGTQLTVTGAAINGSGELWYAVELADGTQGYIRSDLLIEVDEMEVVQASYQSAAKKTSSQEKTTSKSSSGNYIGNKNSKKFHRTSCRTLPKESNRVYFSSRDKAVSSGYAACKNCDP